jgi:hypothetical protein
MSDNKIYSLSQLIDKFDIPRIFSKIDYMKKCATGVLLFTFVTSIISIEIYRNSINYNSKIYKNIDESKKINKTNEEKIDFLIETNKKLLEILERHENLLNSNILNSNIKYNISNNSISNNSSFEEKIDIVDDYHLEFVHECYDILPCNNSKKLTGLNKLFNWI